MCKIDKFGTAIILAGGKSSRMGFDKQFLKIKETRMMEIVTGKLEEEFNEIIIVTNKPELYSDSKYKIVSDIIKGKGPLSGLHVGLKSSKSKYAYFVACDMPNINISYIKYMKEIIEKETPDACVTKCGKFSETFNSFYSKELYKIIEGRLENDNKSVHSLLEKIDTYYVDESDAKTYSPNWDMFINLNTKEELEKYIEVIDINKNSLSE